MWNITGMFYSIDILSYSVFLKQKNAGKTDITATSAGLASGKMIWFC